MSALKDAVVQGTLAVGNLIAGERDRPAQEGRIDERVKKRVNAVAADGAVKTVASVGAPHAAREVARRAGETVIGKVAAGLAARPVVAAGAALLAYDAIRDGVRVANGQMKPSQAVEHLSGSATALAGGTGGAYAGAILGSMLIPVPIVGTIAGTVLGGVVGSVAAGSVGRAAVRKLLDLGGKPAKKDRR